MTAPRNDSAQSRCLSCGGPGAALGYAPRQPLARCAHCGLVFAERWQSGFNAIHEDVYATHLRQAYEYDPLNLSRIGAIFASAERQVSGRRLLDVGCGHGEVVHVGNGRGWDARGIDLSPSAIALCQSKGLACSVLDFFDRSLESAQFDLLTMSEFLEHVPSPVKFLSRARELLRPGGLVYLTTPNFDAASRRVLRGDWPPIHPEHIAYFTQETLQNAATQAGLQTLSLESRNLSLAVPVAMVSKLRARLRPPARASAAAAPSDIVDHMSATQRLRRGISSSPLLQKARDATNGLLALTRAGETLVGWFKLA